MRVLSFGLIGALAALVHVFACSAAVELAHLTPQSGNLAGYLCALTASWLGQSRLTFADRGRGGAARIRFLVTSLTGFALGMVVYDALLRWTSLDYRVALVLVLGAIAALTYLTLRRWVFARAAAGAP